MSKIATIRHTNLTIKGVKKSNTRAIEVIVAGELDVKVGNKQLVFDYDVKVTKKAGKPAEISINGREHPDTKVTVSMLHNFTISDLAFNMNKGSGKWVWDVNGNTTFRSKPVNVTFVHNPGNNYMTINTKLTMKNITGNVVLPGLDDIELDLVTISKLNGPSLRKSKATTRSWFCSSTTAVRNTSSPYKSAKFRRRISSRVPRIRR